MAIGKVKKIFSFILLGLFALMLVSNVFADQYVKINPNPAYNSNDLTGTYNGATSGYKFKWYINDREQVGLSSTLPASLTKVGDNIKLEVYSFGPNGGAFLGEDSLTRPIIADPVIPPVDINHAPVVDITFPTNNYRDVVGSNINFIGTATDSDGDSLTTSWNFGDGSAAVSGTLNTNHIFTTPGTHTITLTATDEHGASASDSVDVIIMENYYNVNNLITYSDRYVHPADTFYRTNPLYAKFNVVDSSGNGVSGLNVDAYLLNMQTGAHLDLTGYTGWVTVNRVRTYIFRGESLFRPNGNYYFKLNNIPITDDFLGANTVLVIAYDNQDRAGRSEKIITILNNPLRFDALPDLTFNEGSSVSIDLDNYVSDIETPDAEITFGISDGNKITGSIDDASHVLTFNLGSWGDVETFTITANDNDGSVVSRTVRVSVGPGYDYNTPDRGDKYAYMHGTPHDFEFELVRPLVYQQTYKAGSDVRLIIEVANKGSVDEDLEIKAYIPGANQYQILGNLHINAGENVYLNEVINLPSKLKTGVQVVQLIAYNEDNVQKTAYQTFVITH